MERLVVTADMWRDEFLPRFKKAVYNDYNVINKYRGRATDIEAPTGYLKRNCAPILMEFRNMDFSRIQFTGIRLFRTLFINCRMPAEMCGVNMLNARFYKCEFNKVRYQNVDFALAKFEDCRIRDSYFDTCDFGAGFATTTFSYDQFRNCSFFETSMARRSSFINCEFYACKHMNSFSEVESCLDISIRNKFINCGAGIGTRSIYRVKEKYIKDPANDGYEIEYTIVHEFKKPRFFR